MATRRQFERKYMPRRKMHELRSAMFEAHKSLPLADRSQMAEWERDLVATVNCAIWEKQLYKISAGLRRLMKIPQRGMVYAKVMELLAF